MVSSATSIQVIQPDTRAYTIANQSTQLVKNAIEEREINVNPQQQPKVEEKQNNYLDSSSDFKKLLEQQREEEEKKSDETTEINKNSLSTEEQILLSKLTTRDTAVRAHESAHISAGAGLISGGASFSYEKGPDNKMYATGGDVHISVPNGSTPHENISLAQQVRNVALAPADPSPQDLAVASTAAIMESRARMEILKEQLLNNSDERETTKTAESNQLEARREEENTTINPYTQHVAANNHNNTGQNIVLPSYA
jgi:vacuolar-type H+-ATPase subunit I/STV1